MVNMISSLNKNININSQTLKEHSKASEKYVDVTFKLSWGNWSGWIPIVYRRTGLNLKTDDLISPSVSFIHSTAYFSSNSVVKLNDISKIPITFKFNGNYHHSE